MKTLVIYQYPQAHQDILDWAKKMKLKIQKTWNIWHFEIKNEIINIFPKDEIFLGSKHYCDKLVLFGAFDKKDLDNINKYVIFKKEKL